VRFAAARGARGRSPPAADLPDFLVVMMRLRGSEGSSLAGAPAAPRRSGEHGIRCRERVLSDATPRSCALNDRDRDAASHLGRLVRGERTSHRRVAPAPI
jgi:hypothetical protein